MSDQYKSSKRIYNDIFSRSLCGLQCVVGDDTTTIVFLKDYYKHKSE